MKKFILLLLMAFPAYPQLIVNGGADFFFTKSSGLDGFVDRYNTTRSAILTKKMESLGTMTGWHAGFGLAMGIAFDLGYSVHKGQLRAETDPSKTIGGGTFRELDIKISNFMIGTGFVVASERNVGVIFPYFEADAQTMSFETRTNSQSKSGDVGMVVNAGIGGKLFIGLGEMFALYIHPSYSFSLLDKDFSEIYDATNTSYDVLSDQTKGSFGGFHLRVGIALMVRD